jgi:hypothetical protein
MLGIPFMTGAFSLNSTSSLSDDYTGMSYTTNFPCCNTSALTLL